MDFEEMFDTIEAHHLKTQVGGSLVSTVPIMGRDGIRFFETLVFLKHGGDVHELGRTCPADGDYKAMHESVVAATRKAPRWTR